jgi:hypothetical protein
MVELAVNMSRDGESHDKPWLLPLLMSGTRHFKRQYGDIHPLLGPAGSAHLQGAPESLSFARHAEEEGYSGALDRQPDLHMKLGHLEFDRCLVPREAASCARKGDVHHFTAAQRQAAAPMPNPSLSRETMPYTAAKLVKPLEVPEMSSLKSGHSRALPRLQLVVSN